MTSNQEMSELLSVCPEGEILCWLARQMEKFYGKIYFIAFCFVHKCPSITNMISEIRRLFNKTLSL